ncbi:MAG: AI-2E family transporter [Myxococcales bacterium]|jgi:predicted PurR-regulated permease PerM
MSTKPPTTEPHIERPGPAEFRDPLVRREMAKAAVWLGMALAIVGVIFLAQPLLLIVGGMIFAVFLDGGARLLGRYLPIPRGWRLVLVLILGFGFVGWVFWFAGTTIAAQFEDLRAVVTAQFTRLMDFAASLGLVPRGEVTNLGGTLLGGVGRLTSAVGTAIGAVTSAIAMIVIGIFLASEPRIYDRGIAWMLPLRHRASFYRVAEHVGFTLRRLLFGRLVGMIFEGFFTWLMLTLGGVPVAALLGLVTGVLAFIPNIGAITSGVLMVAVGFSAGPHQGVYAIFVYFFVQNIDGYLVVPYIARRTVDLAPAVVLAMQLLMGALFGILGVLFADPILATLKVVLVDLSRQQEAKQKEGPDVVEPDRATAGAIPAAAESAAAPASAEALQRPRGQSFGPEPRS